MMPSRKDSPRKVFACFAACPIDQLRSPRKLSCLARSTTAYFTYIGRPVLRSEYIYIYILQKKQQLQSLVFFYFFEGHYVFPDEAL